jgi:DNA-directed RNA polymerase subunit RPC12/RpoP
MRVKVESITLLYTCPVCEEKFRQPLSEIVGAGTAVCPDCDYDCDLEDEVWVDSDGQDD